MLHKPVEGNCSTLRDVESPFLIFKRYTLFSGKKINIMMMSIVLKVIYINNPPNN